MKQFFKLLFLLTFYTSFSIASNDYLKLTTEEKVFIENNPTIKVGVTNDWPPFDFIDNGEYKGLARDYLDIISTQTGLQFEYLVDSWSNLLEKTKNKKIDLLPILAKTEEREKFLLYTQNYLKTRDYLFSNSINYNSLEDLEGKIVAIPKDYSYENYIRKNYPKVKILIVENILASIDAVVTYKAHALISNIAIVDYLTKLHSINNIYANFNLDHSKNNLFMATRDDYDVLNNIISKVLKNISYEERKKISNKWMISKKKIKANPSIELTESEKAFIEQKKKVYIANEYDWKPYDYNENGIAKGYIVDYIKLLSQKVGLEPVFVVDTWSRLVDKVKNKEIDILPVVSKNEKRKEYLNFTSEILNQELTIITKITRTEIVNIDDLNGKKVGMIKSWNLTNLIKEKYPKINLIEFDSLEDILESVKLNFIDATIQNDLLANYYINKKKYENHLKTVGKVSIEGFNKTLFMGTRKDLTVLQSIYNKALSNTTEKEKKVLKEKWHNSSKTLSLTNEERKFIEDTVINVSFTSNWRPFSFEKNSLPQGLAYEYWKLISDKVNLKTNIIFENNFIKSLKTIKDKSRDVILLTSNTPLREEYAIFSNTIFKTPIGIATLKDENYIPDGSYLENKKVAVGKNYTAKRLLEKNYPDIDFIEVSNLKEALEYLSDNKVYAVVDSMPALSEQIKEYGYTNIKISGSTKVTFNMKMMIRDDYKQLQSILNKVLFSLSEEEKEKIKNKWINLEYEENFNYSLIWKIVLFFSIIIIFFIYKNKQLLNYQNELKKTKENLENSLENFKQLIDINIAGILIVRNNKIKYLNDELLNILKYDKKETLTEEDLYKLFPKYTAIELNSINETNESFEFEILDKEQNSIPILIKVKDIVYDNKKSYIISIINLTDIKNKEDLLLQQSKMASLGEMIGNIAHQWRQPLNSISTISSGLKLQRELDTLTDEIFVENMDKITSTTKFLSQTIDDFQNYIKDNKEKDYFNINDSIDKISSILSGSLKNYNIEIKKDIDEIIINSYQNEFNQVLLNILSNSKDALKDLESDKKFIFIKCSKKEKQAVIEIIDNGGGIKKELLIKVFEPYFTTKHKSQGTGLGLYMTHKIITESMQGKIQIETCRFQEFNFCTKVTIKLPLE